jgi:DUF2075 family protein
MSTNFALSIDVSNQYDFHKDSLNSISQNPWVQNQWPLVYFIQNNEKKIAYVGESTNALNRIKNHLGNPERCKLNKISIIGSDKFNKSATLDIESNLIQYITAEGSFVLQNGNYGLINHNYYQQDLYKNLFKEVWNKLIEQRIVTKSLQEIENSEIFKYSPYKALNQDQYNSIIEILDGLTRGSSNKIFISGSAGTGKTILATYLIKLLTSNTDDLTSADFNEKELKEVAYVRDFKNNYPNAKIGLVVAMTSLRESLENVFRKIPGLKSSMILNPSDTFKSKQKFDLLIIDEAHRLRQYKNIGWRGAFKKNNQKLGLDDSGTELDWILSNSKNQIFFYDSAQSIKPSDVSQTDFDELINATSTLKLELKSQMRVKGGNNYIEFVDNLLNNRIVAPKKFTSTNYQFLLFDSFKDLYIELSKKEEELQLCRLVAGYSWEWKSDPKKKQANSKAIDIEIEGLQFQWNQTDKDWINHPKDPKNPLGEIGCIHTVQGYDLNYTGIIFGYEIDYNPVTNKIEIDSSKYFDKYGRIGVNEEELKQYIINIYKTILYRGIKGTFVYACNSALHEYFKIHINSFVKATPFRVLEKNEIKPYVNCIPLVDLTAAAGSFSEIQSPNEITWVEPPFNIAAKKGYFICKVLGESMNKKIPNGAYCLFKQDTGGTRDGKIVLVESTSFKDADFGSGYTVKEYQSKKLFTDNAWQHKSIILRPSSTFDKYEDIVLSPEDLESYKIVGIFDRVLD